MEFVKDPCWKTNPDIVADESFASRYYADDVIEDDYDEVVAIYDPD